MTIHDKSAFKDAQSLARIAFMAYPSQIANQYWAAAMKSLKQAYGVR